MPYVVVAYDISSDKKRLVASEKLRGLGFQRIQKSLYIARGGSSLAKEAYRALYRIIDRSTDTILVMVVPRESLEKAFYTGPEPRVGEEKSIVI